jgi:sulfur carrier protein
VSVREASLMRLIVNGAEREIAHGATVATLLEELAIRRDGTAVALNDDVVPRGQHEQRTLNDCDRLEIIVAVAGG